MQKHLLLLPLRYYSSKFKLMISHQTARQRIEFVEQYGLAEATKHFGITADTIERYQRLINHKPYKVPAVLLFDIETAPMEVYVWGLYKQRISHDNVIKDWFVLSWSAKWLYSSEVMSDVVTSEEALTCNDRRVCNSIWDLFESADVVVAHSALRFDVRKLNSRWMLHGKTPPAPYQVIDTLKESQKMAAHSSHRLDYLGKIMLNKGKLETDYSLWKRCKAGDKEALCYMEKYNKEDVLLLEEVYLQMRPWIRSHPNFGILSESPVPVCATCGCDRIHEAGEYVTPAGAFVSYRCENCGALSRDRTSSIPKEHKKVLKASTAR